MKVRPAIAIIVMMAFLMCGCLDSSVDSPISEKLPSPGDEEGDTLGGFSNFNEPYVAIAYADPEFIQIIADDWVVEEHDGSLTEFPISQSTSFNIRVNFYNLKKSVTTYDLTMHLEIVNKNSGWSFGNLQYTQTKFYHINPRTQDYQNVLIQVVPDESVLNLQTTQIIVWFDLTPTTIGIEELVTTLDILVQEYEQTQISVYDVKFRMMNENGVPMGGISVRLTNEAKGWVYSGSTDPNGYVRFPTVFSGTYVLSGFYIAEEGGLGLVPHDSTNMKSNPQVDITHDGDYGFYWKDSGLEQVWAVTPSFIYSIVFVVIVALILGLLYIRGRVCKPDESSLECSNRIRKDIKKR